MLRLSLVAALAVCLPGGSAFARNPAPSTTPRPASSQKAAPLSPRKLPTAPVPTPPVRLKPLPQPKRILGLMPNYRAVSAGIHPPPATPAESFRIATQDTFDYSGFTFVGVTSLLAEADDAHPSFGKGVGGFGDYYWHGFLDRAGGNYMVLWALPSVLHEDERYYAKGTGSVWSRAVYAATRIVITPNYHGKNTFNAAEILGRGISQAVSLTYYPSATATPSAFTAKYGYALGRDALANVFRELWPDISYHVLRIHRHAAGT